MCSSDLLHPIFEIGIAFVEAADPSCGDFGGLGMEKMVRKATDLLRLLAVGASKILGLCGPGCVRWLRLRAAAAQLGGGEGGFRANGFWGRESRGLDWRRNCFSGLAGNRLRSRQRSRLRSRLGVGERGQPKQETSQEGEGTVDHDNPGIRTTARHHRQDSFGQATFLLVKPRKSTQFPEVL